MILSRKKNYLQIALNSTVQDAISIINQLPLSDRILLEAGTPLIKQFGSEAIRYIYNHWAMCLRVTNIRPYVVADLKIMDRADREVTIAVESGASAAIALGQAPLETINSFVQSCRAQGIDSMLDMMGIEHPIKVLRNLRAMPDVVILHRGVDELEFNSKKPLPYHNIHKIRSTYPALISLAGGDSIRDVQRAIFNDANIVIVWKEFFRASNSIHDLANDFLKSIK